MINSRNFSSETENGVSNKGKLDTFRRKLRTLLYLFPRRYAIALMLFLLLFMKHWSVVNIERFIINALVSPDDDISISNWTMDEVHNYVLVYYLTFIFTQIPGSLVIFTLSSNRFLLISAIGSSIIHMFIPLAARHHSISFLVLIFCEKCFEAPVVIAIMATWKDWSPQWERTKLIMFSIFGIFVIYPALVVFQPRIFVVDSHFYILGAAGLVWALIWYAAFSEYPQNDPLISPNELIYLESSIPSENRQKKSLKDVPWKSVITSKQIAILCIIFLKMSFSYVAVLSGIALSVRDKESFSVFYAFVSVFAIVIVCSAIVSDFLIKKYSERTLLIRKIFLCCGLTLQFCFMLGLICTSGRIKAILFATSYVMYAASLSGCITLPLDLSPRYVALITAILFTFFHIGETCTNILLYVRKQRSETGMDALNNLFLWDGIISLVCAGLFAVWGDVKEQLWSFNSTSVRGSSNRSGKDLDLENKCDTNSEPENA